MELGTLAAIHRYPVKSLRGESLDEVAILHNGVDGDRLRALMVTDGLQARLGKPYRGKENDRLHLDSTLESGIEQARERGVSVESEEDDDPIVDDAPVSIIVDVWLRGLNQHLGYDVGYSRFRPNFFVHARNGFSLTEEAMTGREVALGDTMLRVRYPIGRCVTITYDQTGGDSDPEILAYVARERSTWMGIYCDVLRAGTVRIGDSFSLVER